MSLALAASSVPTNLRASCTPISSDWSYFALHNRGSDESTTRWAFSALRPVIVRDGYGCRLINRVEGVVIKAAPLSHADLPVEAWRLLVSLLSLHILIILVNSVLERYKLLNSARDLGEAR